MLRGPHHDHSVLSSRGRHHNIGKHLARGVLSSGHCCHSNMLSGGKRRSLLSSGGRNPDSHKHLASMVSSIGHDCSLSLSRGLPHDCSLSLLGGLARETSSSKHHLDGVATATACGGCGGISNFSGYINKECAELITNYIGVLSSSDALASSVAAGSKLTGSPQCADGGGSEHESNR